MTCLTSISSTVIEMMARDLFPAKLRGGGRLPLQSWYAQILPQHARSDQWQNRSHTPQGHSETAQHQVYILNFPSQPPPSHTMQPSPVKALRSTGKQSIRDYTSNYVTPLICHLPCSSGLAAQCPNASAQGGLTHLALLELL